MPRSARLTAGFAAAAVIVIGTCPPALAQNYQLCATLEARLEQLGQQAAGGSGASQRRNILAMLGANRCAPQYAGYGQRSTAGGGMFLRDHSRDPYLRDSPFGSRRGLYGNGASYRSPGPYDTYRTLCVRACDGYYWPISFSTVQGRFGFDQQLCQRSCPGTDVSLFVHRNPGEGPEQAISLAGQPYSTTTNAFRYRDEYVADCGCKGGVQTAALGSYDAGGRVSVDLPARDGTAPTGIRTWAKLRLPATEPAAAAAAAQSARSPDTGKPTLLPRPRPGNEIPVAGTMATLTGREDFVALAPPATAKPANGPSIRIVGPGSTLYRPAAE